MKTAIIGHGIVGKAQQVLFPDAYIYTRHIGNKEEVNQCDIAFICIPAIYNEQQERLDTTDIEDILKWIKCRLIIIKTTLNVGDTARLSKKYDKRIIFSPEFLRDKHWRYDIMHEERVIISAANPRYQEIDEVAIIYNKVYGKDIVVKIDSIEAEFLKLFTNCFLASKVTLYAQTLHNYTSKLKMSADTISQYKDKRIYPSHTQYKGQWGGKCFPKDYRAIIALGKKIGADTSVLEAIWKYNERQ